MLAGHGSGAGQLFGGATLPSIDFTPRGDDAEKLEHVRPDAVESVMLIRLDPDDIAGLEVVSRIAQEDSTSTPKNHHPMIERVLFLVARLTRSEVEDPHREVRRAIIWPEKDLLGAAWAFGPAIGSEVHLRPAIAVILLRLLPDNAHPHAPLPSLDGRSKRLLADQRVSDLSVT